MARRVFLSYRRSDAANQATALKIVLEKLLPGVSVFVDTQSISPGDVWPDRLQRALNESAALVVVIGKNWRFGEDQTDQFDDENDWPLREVAWALRHLAPGRVVPVVLDGHAEPNLIDLPESLSDLARIQAWELSSGSSFGRDVDAIASKLAQQLGEKKAKTAITFPAPDEIKAQAPSLSEDEFDDRKVALRGLNGWTFSKVLIPTEDGDTGGTELSKSFTFQDFKPAFTFMARAAIIAEAKPHHPEWTNVWNRVDIRLRTFDAGQLVTWYDVEMACALSNLAEAVQNETNIVWPLT